MGFEQRARIRANVDGSPKGCRDAIGCDVVMGGTNTATGEDIVIGFGQRLYRSHNGGFRIADHAHFAQIDPRFGQRPGQIVHIRIACASRQDFIPDHQHGSGRIWHV